ncbi:hypothetical protein HELRODRAFT_178716 [Helobdella robusta]|uniref:ISXO2-like transposase domain-containing protein n=1 Tax=Helobdella robusta TaxID=6412 RepID=T1FDM2_HELRO|nr:hypothetical protein HELRODRAFT_178716 [Helobdella robusta]ESN96916.1 hypothetical protein HELRODRAFT_178716 [Helobdella robusta]
MAAYPSVEEKKFLELIDYFLKFAESALTADGYLWRFRNSRCRATKTIRHGSFYSHSQLSLTNCILMTYFWSMYDVSQAMVASILDLDVGHTLSDWFNLHRDLCIDWARDNPARVGGPGHIVQIDESCISSAKRSRNRNARPVRTRRVLGGIDTQTKDAFLVEVNKRDAATLLPLIQRHVLPGWFHKVQVWTDQWATYNSITAVTGLAHQTVNHSITFRAVNVVHTNGVENLCNQLP